MPLNVTLPILHLASQSPRRRQLLEAIGLPYVVHSPDALELHPSSDEIDRIIIQNARAKAESVLGKLSNEEDIVLGADTLVLLDKRVLGKPTDQDNAVETLTLLSGQTQTVVTGLHLCSPRYGERSLTVRSSVTFRKLAPEEIKQYVQTREPYDKAGAYAVQGLGALFIQRIDGSYTNVMGLPIEAVMKEMSALTHIPIYEWFR